MTSRPRLRSRRSRHPWLERLLPALVFAIVAALSITLSLSVRSSRQEFIQSETRIGAEQLRLRLQAWAMSRVTIAEHVAEDWLRALEMGIDHSESFRRQAQHFLDRNPGFQAFNWIDSDWVIRIIVPEAGNLPALDRDLHHHPEAGVPMAIRRALHTRSTAATHIIELLQGGRGFAGYTPVIGVDGRLFGYVNTVFRVQEMVDSALLEPGFSDRFHFELREVDGSAFFAHGETQEGDASRFSIRLPVHVIDQVWLLELAPNSEFLSDAANPLDEALIPLGLILGWLAAWLVRRGTDRTLQLREQESLSRALLAWSQQVHETSSYQELIDVVRGELAERVGYRNVWLLMHSETDENEWHAIAASGDVAERMQKLIPTVKADSTKLLLEISLQSEPIIVANAQLGDDTDVERAQSIGMHTLLMFPFRTVDKRRVVMGVGSFGEQGVQLPTETEFEYLRRLAVQVQVAAGRIGFQAERHRAEEERRAFDARIQQTQKLESLGVLAGGIAHDFNNLLVGIMGNTELARLDADDPECVRKSLVEVERAAQRAAELANQMLAYSGKGRFIVRPLDLNELVEEMTQLLSVSISKKAELDYDFDHEIPLLQGDPTQIRQVLMNLITNASDALGDEPGRIVVRTGRQTVDRAYLRETYLQEDLPEGEYVYVEVEDSGCGMDEATQAKIFDPFFTTKFTGRGLGMAAVLGIARAHRGAIHLRSTPGTGTVFRILFSSLSDVQPIEAQPQMGEVTSESGSTVLVVDDEEMVRSLARDCLERFGFQVLTARDGEEALEVFRAHRSEVAAVLLDVTMPRLDGAETFLELKAIDPAVRVVLSSGFSESEAVSRFEPSDLAAFIQKPYRPAELAATMRAAVGAVRSSSISRETPPTTG